MNWSIYLNVAMMVIIATALWAYTVYLKKYKTGRVLTPSRIIFGGVIISAIILFIPIYENAFKDTGCGWLEIITISMHNMIRLFVVDGEFGFVTDSLASAPKEIAAWYTGIFAIIFVVAPVLTFSFVLSFFKNASAYAKLFFHGSSEMFIFSELNEKSLALAKDLRKNSKKRLLVFTDVFEKEEETSYELIERAKELSAVCFKKDIITIDFSHYGGEKYFMIIGEDESENTNQALKILSNKKYGTNGFLYVFTTQVESEILLANAFNEGKGSGIKVRRVNDVRSLISRTLYDTGYEKIFCSAYDDGTDVKKINAVIIGMGQQGTEMTKALSWFCQMDGYQVEINSFDGDVKASDKFVCQCPELMDEKFNGKYDIDGESKYKITIHSGIDVDTKEFEDLVVSLPRTTYVFVSLGNDEKNISTAIKLRTIFARQGYTPVIQSVVYETEKKQALTDIKNFKKEPYDIDFIGDLETSFSEKVIMGMDVEEKALARHTKWGQEHEFWQYDYNHKSSVASAIHYEMKCKCGIPGINKPKEERTEEELWAIRKLEHCRWNAYMRSEGYVYGGTTEREGRYDLAKKHNCLVPFDKLPLKEQEKDDD